MAFESLYRWLQSWKQDSVKDVDPVKLIAGLGNPGPKYARNRHNVGMQCLDVLAARHNIAFDKTQGKARLGLGEICGTRVALLRPMTYMNLSGEAVGPVARFYKIPAQHILVLYDDMDLPLGKIRVRPRGGAGGHNGIKSLIQHLESDEFHRVRIGIGRPHGRMDPAAYVLQDFSAAEEEELALIRPRVADAVESWLRVGITQTMNEYNALSIG